MLTVIPSSVIEQPLRKIEVYGLFLIVERSDKVLVKRNQMTSYTDAGIPREQFHIVHCPDCAAPVADLPAAQVQLLLVLQLALQKDFPAYELLGIGERIHIEELHHGFRAAFGANRRNEERNLESIKSDEHGFLQVYVFQPQFEQPQKDATVGAVRLEYLADREHDASAGAASSAALSAA